jgi:hypothetical protein
MPEVLATSHAPRGEGHGSPFPTGRAVRAVASASQAASSGAASGCVALVVHRCSATGRKTPWSSTGSTCHCSLRRDQTSAGRNYPTAPPQNYGIDSSKSWDRVPARRFPDAPGGTFQRGSAINNIP